MGGNDHVTAGVRSAMRISKLPCIHPKFSSCGIGSDQKLQVNLIKARYGLVINCWYNIYIYINKYREIVETLLFVQLQKLGGNSWLTFRYLKPKDLHAIKKQINGNHVTSYYRVPSLNLTTKYDWMSRVLNSQNWWWIQSSIFVFFGGLLLCKLKNGDVYVFVRCFVSSWWFHPNGKKY